MDCVILVQIQPNKLREANAKLALLLSSPSYMMAGTLSSIFRVRQMP